MLMRLGPPIGAFVLARVALWWFALGVGHNALHATAWSHWDSAHYLSIAEHGYEFFSCARLPGYDPKLFCGNMAWLPGYPLLIRLVATLGITPLVAGALVSALFALGILILFWNLFLGPKPTLAGALALVFAAFFPGHFYDHAVFPISMFAFLQVLALRFYVDRQFAWAGIAGGLAAFTYSSGLFLCAVFGLHLLGAERQRSYRDQLIAIALAPGLVAVGFLCALLLQWIEVGTWNAFFLVQAKYAYQFTWPTTPLAASVSHVIQHFPTIGPSTQSLFVAIVCLSLLWRALATRPVARVDAVMSLFLIVYWLVPLMMGGSLSIYRAESTLLPAAAPLAGRLRPAWLAALLLLALLVSRAMSKLFFKNVLV